MSVDTLGFPELEGLALLEAMADAQGVPVFESVEDVRALGASSPFDSAEEVNEFLVWVREERDASLA